MGHDDQRLVRIILEIEFLKSSAYQINLSVNDNQFVYLRPNISFFRQMFFSYSVHKSIQLLGSSAFSINNWYKSKDGLKTQHGTSNVKQACWIFVEVKLSEYTTGNIEWKSYTFYITLKISVGLLSMKKFLKIHFVTGLVHVFNEQ